MTASDLLGDHRARGVGLVAAGDRIRYRPADALTDADRAALRVHKSELTALLTAESVTVATSRHCDRLPPCPRRGGMVMLWSKTPSLFALPAWRECRWCQAMTREEFLVWLATAGEKD